jgi:hypothetical protein
VQTAPARSSVPSGTVGKAIYSRKQSRPTAFIRMSPKYTALLGFENRVHRLLGTAATKHSVMRRIAGLVVSMKRDTDRKGFFLIALTHAV